MPEGEHVEEVNLVEYEETRSAGGRREAYHDDDDDDDDMPGAQRVQCANQ